MLRSWLPPQPPSLRLTIVMHLQTAFDKRETESELRARVRRPGSSRVGVGLGEESGIGKQRVETAGNVSLLFRVPILLSWFFLSYGVFVVA